MKITLLRLFGLALLLVGFVGAATAVQLKPVGPGDWRPFYPPSPKQTTLQVPRFWLQATPVTNGDYLQFVAQHAEWQRSKISRLFADEQYLKHWQGDLELGNNIQPQQPVVNVSWYAAKAYCESLSLQLPSEAQWELAAQASEVSVDASRDPVWRQRILRWYSESGNKPLSRVGVGPANYWGIYDLHGLIWEWVLDFNSTMFAVDNRSEGDANRIGFCGSGSLKTNEKEDYASFMRMAFRSSLKASFTTSNLGFRCAQSTRSRE